MSNQKLSAGLQGLAAAAVVACAGSAVAAPMANLVVVHGIPGADLGLPNSLPVDVLVNGTTCLLKGFTFGTIAGPVALPAGTYTIAISLADSAMPCGAKAIITAKATLKAGTYSAAVAALSTRNTPTAELFAIDNSPVPPTLVRFLNANASNGLATFRVTDAQGYVYNDTQLAGKSDFVSAAGPSTGYSVTVRGASGKPIGPFKFNQQARGEALLFAVGSARTGSLTVLSQSLQFK